MFKERAGAERPGEVLSLLIVFHRKKGPFLIMRSNLIMRSVRTPKLFSQAALLLGLATVPLLLPQAARA